MIVIGIGHEFRGDDRAGLEVVRRLGNSGLDANLIEHSGEGASLMSLWEFHPAVIVVDAVRSGNPPGHIFRLDAHSQTIPTRFFHYSSHDFSLAEAVEMSRTLNRLPARFVIFGIEGRRFDIGDTMSEPVLKAVEEVTEKIIEEIKLSQPS